MLGVHEYFSLQCSKKETFLFFQIFLPSSSLENSPASNTTFKVSQPAQNDPSLRPQKRKKKCLYEIEDKMKGQAVPGEVSKLLGDSA